MKKVDKKLEIASLKTLAENYKKRSKSKKKREIIPFELDIGNFCCEKLKEKFEKNEAWFDLEYIAGKLRVHIREKSLKGNYCRYCDTSIDGFFYIKEY